ncbi:translation initiation factor IF3-2, chloroplastic-like isoform X1 [Musa acuminata AAA Group]|uniref:translation initiation factor IF3-2, chloroplastic-like isoform X1 n=1 Tax=Musa acuminata AAA Group TaxID=214697 RepID=UPI0031DDD967
MARIAVCSFNPSPSLSSPVSDPSRRLRAALLPLPFKIPTNRVRGRRPLVAVVARFGGGGNWRGPSRRRPIDGRAAADPDYDPALDLDRVKSSSVRLLDEQQNMLGVVSIDEAIQMADDADLILAILSIDADPPVLRLFESSDYNILFIYLYRKHKYEQQKKKKVQQKRSAANRMDIKELKMGYNIDSHDYSVRLKAAQKFLKDGDKVKIIVNLKGRENEFRNIAIKLIQRFQSDIGELATEETKNFSQRNIFMVLVPNKVVLQKTQEQPKKKEKPVTEVSASV